MSLSLKLSPDKLQPTFGPWQPAQMFFLTLVVAKRETHKFLFRNAKL